MPNIAETIKIIKTFAGLPEGWRFGKGGAADEDKIDLAIRLVSYAEALGISRANAFSGDEKEILVSFYAGQNNIDLTLEANNTITFAEDCEDEQIEFQDGLRRNDAYEQIWKFSQKNQNILALSIQKTTTLKAENLRALRSNLIQTIKASPALKPPVQLRVSGRAANTWQNSTKTKQTYPKSTGTSHRKTSLKVA